MKIESRMKHNLEMVVKYFRKFVEDIEDYQFEYRGNEEMLDLLQDTLTTGNPFNRDLMEVLSELYEYEENFSKKIISKK